MNSTLGNEVPYVSAPRRQTAGLTRRFNFDITFSFLMTRLMMLSISVRRKRNAFKTRYTVKRRKYIG